MKHLKALALLMAFVLCLGLVACSGKDSGSAMDGTMINSGSATDDTTTNTTTNTCPPHSAVDDAAVAPTCTENGLTAGSHCALCGETIVAQEVVPAPGHTLDGGSCGVCGLPGASIGVTYTLNADGTGYILSDCGNCADTELRIDTYNNLPITAIADEAFKDCTSLVKVVISDSVKTIGANAFNGCTHLGSVTIGANVESIGDGAFNSCTSLAEVINLSNLAITKGTGTFGNAGRFALEVHKGASKLDVQDDFMFYTVNGTTYLVGYLGNATNLVLPASYNNGTYKINQYALQKNPTVKTLVIGDGVTEIGYQAVGMCPKLTSVVIGDNVTKIGGYAFYKCYSLASVTLGASVNNIQGYAFQYCDAMAEVINNSNMFVEAKQSSIDGYIGAYVLEVHKGASKVVHQGDYVFYTLDGRNYLIGYTGDSTDLVLPDSYNGQDYAIKHHAFFERTDLTSIVFSDAVVRIDNFAFAYWSTTATFSFASESSWQITHKTYPTQYCGSTNANIAKYLRYDYFQYDWIREWIAD